MEFIINGDLNGDLSKQPLENNTKHFVHTCESHQLTQLVNKPTRITPTSRTLIDVIMTTEPDKMWSMMSYLVVLQTTILCDLL